MNSQSNSRSQKGRVVLASLFAFGLSLAFLGGCSGSDGDTGAQGPTGPSSSGPTSSAIDQGDALPGIQLAIVSLGGATGPGGNFAVGDRLSVNFTLTKSDSSVWDLAEMDFARILVSGPTFNYQRVLPELADVATVATQNADGSYTYRFAAGIPATYAAPYNDSAAFDATDGELTGQALLSGTYTVGLYVGWNYTVDDEAKRDAANATHDFQFGTTSSLDAREVVRQDNCNVCHSSLRAHGDLRRDVKLCVLCHTAGAEDKNTAGVTPGVSVEFKSMIHRIHNGAHLPSVLGITTNNDGSLNYTATPVANEFVGFQDSVADFSEVTFPVFPNFNVAMPKDTGYSQLSSTDPDGSGPLLSPRTRNDRTRTGVTACAKCHGDPDASGPLVAPAQGTLYRSQPTEQACGSCHDDVRWGFPYTTNGQTMPDTANNTNCILCHLASGDALAIDDAHLHPLSDAALDPGVNTVITAVTGGSGPGGNFTTGDTPSVTFTLQNDAGVDIGVSTMDSCSAFFFGPNENRQLVMPLTSANGMSLNPFDFAGRLQAVSTTNKGTMSKVLLGTPAVQETLTVQFTSATAFTVTGSTNGALGTGALPTTPTTNSTNPSGSSVSGIALGSSVGTGTVQISFSDSTHFTVAASPGGALGAGELPGSTSASTRFTSTTISFNISVGTAAFANGNTVNIATFRGSAANPVLFAVVAGRTAFSATAGAADRFYYNVEPDAPSYTVKLPMDLQYEYLGDGTATVGQTLFPGNVPVRVGYPQLFEATTTSTTTTTTAAVNALGRQIDVTPAVGFASNDIVVFEPAAGIGQREYVQVTPAKADGTTATATDTTTRLIVRTPLRYAHALGATVTKVSLALKLEGASSAYVLTPGTSTAGSAVITSNIAFSGTAGMVMTYRTDARFGYKRDPSDTVQAYFVPPANDTVAIGQEQGDWQGLPYLNGTYTADMWFYKNVDLGRSNELQTYRSTANAGTFDFLYGTASEIVPHEIISSSSNCYTCHNDVLFHGGGRRGLDACLTCHSISGNTSSLLPASSVAIEFRQMLHKIHRGADLPDAATYPFASAGEFPAMPGGVRNCDRCHGNDAWKAPQERVHPLADVPVRAWGTVCGSCHSSSAEAAHITVQTTTLGAESCAVCHGPGKEWSVERVHKTY